MALLRATRSTSCLVALSGGKDSIATLDICTQLFERVEAFFMYYVRNLRCIEERLNPLRERYGVTIHYVPHFQLANMLKGHNYTGYNDQAEKWTQTKLADIECYVRQTTGIDWIAYGWRATDCFERRAILSKNKGIDAKNHHVYPIAQWRVDDVRRYCAALGIRLPATVGKSFDICPSCEAMKFLIEHYPDDYERFKKTFPFIEALIKREEYKQTQ